MAGTNQIRSFASGAGANVISQASYDALTTLLANGFVAGVAGSSTLNKVWRQSSFMAAGLAAFVANQGPNVNDDGDVANLAANILTAVQAVINASPSLKPGMFVDFGGSTPPAGYLACPTAQTNISRTTYAALFAAIGTTWGAGDGSTTFGMPWFAADYAAVQSNSNVGTTTVGAVIAHTHPTPSTFGGGVGATYAGSTANFNPSVTPTQSTGGPANLAAGARVLKCIKY